MLNFGIEGEALCLKDHKKQQDLDLDWTNLKSGKILQVQSTVSCCCFVVVELKNHFG